ncbi:PREDICTED: uncharacterized protein LOC107342772 isoform X16 [Acropora digitifera]|uniref:uncharacterized protein LOC107342772 isoform X16 n=1 Tax=Acropora digitifera TaxID=70779 RepID=UPI00077A8078|nr:PREDICTED: uncharacterized protein LOC107342772 isoform X16 [Acropora digitifera]
MAFRRSFSSSYNCDQSIINSGALRGSGGSWIARYRCSSGYCSFGTIANTGFQCTDFSVDEDWTMGENNFTYTFSSVSKEWIVSYQGCCWISSLVKYPDGNWLVSTTVNLTRRADTGRINSSPVSKSPAIIRFEEGCPQSFRIPVEDPDDDVVKCRWATYSESSRQADSFPHGVIDERACLLQYNGRNRTAGTYAVALTLEDFPEGTTDFSSITRFSAVGLQFLVIVTARSGSCTDVPLFTKSTPSDGECTEVQIGSAYRAVIEVKLQDLLRHVTEIVTSSPVGMQLTPLRQDALLGIFYRNITWYPSQYQVGQQLFCFKAKDSAGSESEWRCITILVGLSNTPRVVLGTQWPRYPSSQFGTGFMWLSIQFDRVIKKPRTSAYVRLVLRPSEHTVYKVDTLSRNVVISANKTALLFALPKAALSMRGSYAILIDRGAVVGLGCSFDGPPTPGMSSPKDWGFNVYGICSTGYSLDPPYYRSCVDVNECGNPSRKKRYAWWGPVTSTSSSPTPTFSTVATSSPGAEFSHVSTSTPGSCGYNFTDRQGNLTSPNYPFSYPNDLNCLWTITARPGDYIYLYFTYFYVQGHFYSRNYGYRYGQYGYNHYYCPYDYVEMFDLNYPSSFVKVRGCGYQSPWCVKSKSHVMHIRFVTDIIYSYRGFTANYTVYRTRPAGDNCLSLNPYASSSTIFSATPTFSTVATSSPGVSASVSPPFPSGSCGYNFTDRQGNLSSPNYPFSYPSNLNCLWTITATPGDYIYLYFTSFYVQGYYSWWYWGYNAHYYYGQYGRYGYNSYCPYDYVDIFDLNYPSSFIKVRGCGQQSPWCVKSKSHVMHIRFVTNSIYSYRGFTANYTVYRTPPVGDNCLSLNPYASSSTIFSATPTFSQVSTSTPGSCVYNLTNPQGNFTSPNHPSPHQHYLNCFWTITAAPGYYIHLYFLYFHLEYGSSYCPYDYVEVTDPNYPTSSIKIKRCGYQIPWCVTSTSNVLYVRFVTDGSVAYSGFFASYTNHPNPFSGNCTSLNATQIQTTQGSSPIAMPISALHPTSSSITGVPASASLPFPSVGIIYPTPASKRLPHYSSTVTQEKVPDFYLQLPADCEQVCQNTAGSYICSCVSGYQLASDGKSCSDINECSVNNGGCSHHCYNIPGAHYCGCPEGTTMAANNLTCVQPGVTVTCGERNMTISLEKQSLSFVRAEEVHLRYSSCKATENGTHVTISTLLNDCGTSVNETQDALLFWNELRVDAVIIDDVITRSHDIRLPFYCSYSRKKLLSLSFNSLGVYYGQEEGYGNFTFKMDFFKSGSFLTPYRTADYPLQLRLNDYIYVRYSVQSSADLVIMAENCRATKDGSFYSLPQYKIIQNGCGRDTTMVYSYNSNRPYQEFRMKVFRFYNDYNAVYLHCELLACHRSSRNSRCQRGCMPGNRRKRRAVSRDGTEHMESTTKNIVSRGPLIFKDEVKQGDTGQGKVGAWIGGVAGAGGVCILAFAALGILLVKYRSARRLMNRNKVGDLFATQEEMGRKSANVKEDNMNTKEDSL